MKKAFLILSLPLLLLGCKSANDKADIYGNFEADSYYISTELPGKITLMNVTDGSLVKAGQTIASIDSMQLYYQKEQLKARVLALKSKLQDVPVQLASLQEKEQILTKELARVKALFADKAATQKQLDDLSGELNVTKKQIVAMKSQLSTANRGILSEIEPVQWQILQLEDQLSKTQITATTDGTVLESFKEAGELILPGQPLVKMANLKSLTLRGFISGSQLGEIKIGQTVKVSVDTNGDEMKSLSGKVTWIASEAEFTPKTIQTKEERVNLVYAIKIEVPNDGSLKIGMPGEAVFSRESAAGSQE